MGSALEHRQRFLGPEPLLCHMKACNGFLVNSVNFLLKCAAFEFVPQIKMEAFGGGFVVNKS